MLPNIDSFVIGVNIEHETEKYTSALRIRVYKNQSTSGLRNLIYFFFYKNFYTCGLSK